MKERLIIIGGGLAGSEAAWQAAQLGIEVQLFEMRPLKQTPAHETERLAELVCSNSLGSQLIHKAPGLLKAELRGLGSMILRCAEETAVPAGSALAVDRQGFAEAVREVDYNKELNLKLPFIWKLVYNASKIMGFIHKPWTAIENQLE